MYDIGEVIDNVYVVNVDFCERTRTGFNGVAENQKRLYPIQFLK
jgi:hypothetical protein